MMGASTFVPSVDLIFKVLLGISTLLVAVVWILIVYFSFRYHRSSRASRANPPRQPRAMELSLCALVFVFGLGIFIWSARTFYRMYSVPPNAVEIDVIAKQWMWVFHDPRAGDQINAVKVPLNRPVRLVMTSEDVIHSFFVPAFRIKQDVLPGRYTSLWFQATELGRFDVLCTQYCGLEHSEMRAVIEVVTPEEYERAPLTKTEPGRKLFAEKSCTGCHEGTHPIGPRLEHLYHSQVALTDGRHVLADENYLRRAILEPNADVVAGYPPVMPTFKGQLDERQLLALIDYLKASHEQ